MCEDPGREAPVGLEEEEEGQEEEEEANFEGPTLDAPHRPTSLVMRIFRLAFSLGVLLREEGPTRLAIRLGGSTI